jgi:hypothetical protein
VLIPIIKDLICKNDEAELVFEGVSFREGRHLLTNEDLDKIDALRYKLVELHGLPAKKLSKPIPREYYLTEEDEATYKRFTKERSDKCVAGRQRVRGLK